VLVEENHFGAPRDLVRVDSSISFEIDVVKAKDEIILDKLMKKSFVLFGRASFDSGLTIFATKLTLLLSMLL
jgi:hypothetical protein